MRRKSTRPAAARREAPADLRELGRLARAGPAARPRALLALQGRGRPAHAVGRDRDRLQHRERVLRADPVRGAGGGVQGGLRRLQGLRRGGGGGRCQGCLTAPCGACRQILWEFCGDIVVHMEDLQGQHLTKRLSELLPLPLRRALPLTVPRRRSPALGRAGQWSALPTEQTKPAQRTARHPFHPGSRPPAPRRGPARGRGRAARRPGWWPGRPCWWRMPSRTRVASSSPAPAPAAAWACSRRPSVLPPSARLPEPSAPSWPEAKRAVFRSREGAEDRDDRGRREGRRLRPGDVLVGISASSVTPFVRGALAGARSPAGPHRARHLRPWPGPRGSWPTW